MTALVWREANWLGKPTLKCPFDLWIYQELLYELRPDVIIETGTFLGGSALYLASVCELIDQGRVISIDNKTYADQPTHTRLRYLHGSSVASETVAAIQRQVQPGDVVMVILDSDHSKAHVLREMQIYSQLVTLGSYLIVEDTNINGHPVWPDFGPGPMEAVETFLKGDDRFMIDRAREKFYLTFNPGGYLKKVK